MVNGMSDREYAKKLIAECESALGYPLSSGMKRDLLMDNTEWDSSFIRRMVDAIEHDTPSAYC